MRNHGMPDGAEIYARQSESVSIPIEDDDEEIANYDDGACEKCGCGSADDVAVWDGKTLCPDCHAKLAAIEYMNLAHVNIANRIEELFPNLNERYITDMAKRWLHYVITFDWTNFEDDK
jgi:hypothetical protein